MLNSCGHALSQGDGSDLHPRCNCEATPPGYSTCGRTWRRLAPCHGATPAQTYYANPVKLEKIGECWQVQLIVGGVGHGAAEEDGCWDLNPGMAAI